MGPVLQISYVPIPMERLVQRTITATALHEFCRQWDEWTVDSIVSGHNLLCRHGAFITTHEWWKLQVWMLLTRDLGMPISRAADLCELGVLPMVQTKLEAQVRSLVLTAAARHYWARIHLAQDSNHINTLRA